MPTHIVIGSCQPLFTCTNDTTAHHDYIYITMSLFEGDALPEYGPSAFLSFFILFQDLFLQIVMQTVLDSQGIILILRSAIGQPPGKSPYIHEALNKLKVIAFSYFSVLQQHIC